MSTLFQLQQDISTGFPPDFHRIFTVFLPAVVNWLDILVFRLA